MSSENTTPSSEMINTDQTAWMERPVFKAYAFYSCILVLKMMLLSVLTIIIRLKRKVVSNPEDASVNTNGVVKFDDPYVERRRRGHLNDLENIPIFFTCAFVYSLTNPNPTVAINLFRVFTLVRFLHTFVYAIFVIRQPARAICFFSGFLITGYMAFASICHYFSLKNI